jgi:hypothetical protein
MYSCSFKVLMLNFVRKATGGTAAIIHALSEDLKVAPRGIGCAAHSGGLVNHVMHLLSLFFAALVCC